MKYLTTFEKILMALALIVGVFTLLMTCTGIWYSLGPRTWAWYALSLCCAVLIGIIGCENTKRKDEEFFKKMFG